MGKTVAYLRVSTDEQDIENQRLEITTYADRKGFCIDEWIKVEMSSRKNFRDRKIDKLINNLKREDTLIVSELSRLARSIRETHNIVHAISKKKVEMHIIKQNLITRDNNDMATKIFINAFAMASEIERDLISQRTKNGIALARKRGKRIGNPNLKADNQKRIDKANEFAESRREILNGLINNGLTQRQIVDELNKAGIKTPRNREWSLIQLQRLLKRLGLSTKKVTNKPDKVL